MNDKMLLKFAPPPSPRCKWPFIIFNINDCVDSKQGIHEVWHFLHSNVNLKNFKSFCCYVHKLTYQNTTFNQD